MVLLDKLLEVENSRAKLETSWWAVATAPRFRKTSIIIIAATAPILISYVTCLNLEIDQQIKEMYILTWPMKCCFSNFQPLVSKWLVTTLQLKAEVNDPIMGCLRELYAYPRSCSTVFIHSVAIHKPWKACNGSEPSGGGNIKLYLLGLVKHAFLQLTNHMIHYLIKYLFFESLSNIILQKLRLISLI